jgi:predicted helicase
MNRDIFNANRMNDEQYMFRLIGQVIAVSLETMKVVKGLPELREREA